MNYLLTVFIIIFVIAGCDGTSSGTKNDNDIDDVETEDISYDADETMDETVDESVDMDETTDEDETVDADETVDIDETIDADETIDEDISVDMDEIADEDETIDEDALVDADYIVDEDETVDETTDTDIEIPYTSPEITSEAPTEGFKEGYPYSYSIVCSDPDGDELTITLEDNYCGGVLTDNGDGTALYEVETLGASCSFYVICSDSVSSDSEEVYFSSLTRFAKVKDIRPGSSYSSNPAYFNEVAGKLVFYALDGEGSGYYTSDGTTEGTVSFYRNPAINSPIYTKRAGNKLFASHGTGQLWKIDATESGTKMLADVCAADISGCAASSPIGGSTVYDNSIYLYANYPLSGSPWVYQKIWASDGTESGTKIIFDSKNIGAGITQLTASQGKLFFIMSTYEFDSENGHGNEVMYINPDGTGVTLTKDIRPGNSSYGSTPSNLTDIGNKLLFTAYDTDNIKGLYVTDLAVSGDSQTLKLFDIDSNKYSIYKIIADKKNNRAFILLNDITSSTDGEIWVTDGTSVNLTKLGTFNKSALQMSASEVFDGVLYFGNDSGSYNYELWKSDGTTAGTVKITNLDKVVKNMIYSTTDSRLYYSTTDDLYYTDGTDAGSIKLSGINVSYNNNGFSKEGPNIGLYIFGGNLYIAGRMTSSSDTELYRYGIDW